MTVPYRYIKGAAAGRDETCVRCGSRSTRLVVDHCHLHGFARGLLCKPCNARLAILDAGTTEPTPREAFYLGNCPECRKAESIDSPHALALRIGAIALAVASALDLSPRQAATLALSLAEASPDGGEREVAGREREVPQHTARPLPEIPESVRGNLSALVRHLTERGCDRREVREAVSRLSPTAAPDSLKKAVQRYGPKN